jgi:prepilin-type N-terminal cleavage/methylation domain-containing protein
MRPFHTPQRKNGGYSLIEMMVVMAIVGVLVFAGASYLGDKRGNAVRSVMDEIEGVIMNAQNSAQLSSMDIYVSSTGQWTDGTLIIDARPLNTAAVGFPPTASALKAGTDANRLGSSSECFRSRYKTDRDHQTAGVNCGTNWYNTALGSASDLRTVAPVSTNSILLNAMTTPLCLGTLGDSYVILNGRTRRFETGFYIVVVGLSSGSPVPGGSVGVLLVPQNSSNVYKFYKPAGSVTWRRL